MRYTLRTLTLKPGLVTSQDEPERVRFSKQLTLIIYLALRPRARATREELLGLLWAGATEHDARSSLRQVLYQIRQATDPDLVVGDEVLRLRREDVDFDVDLFRVHHAQGRLEEALRLYEADFLSNVAQAGAGEFEEWAEGLRQQLSAERRQVLRTLISRMADQGRWSEGAQYAQLLIEADPGVLEPRVKLVELLALSGDAIRAAGAAADARAFVESIEGSRLSPEVERAIALAMAPVVPAAREAVDPLTRLPEMVGRAAEFRVLVDKWRSALEGRGKAALLTGEAGIGKTRLTREVAGRLRRDRCLILRSACYAVEQSDAMAPFVDLLRSAPRAPGLAGASPSCLSILGAFVPEIADRFRSAVAPSALPVDPQSLGTALLEAFAAIAEEVPLLLVVEDLHWASPEAIEFAHRLARRAQAHHILLLLTARDYGDVPGATESLRALTATGAVREVPLGSLDLPEVQQLLSSIADLPDPESGRWLAQELLRPTQGVPLYVLEVLKSLHDSGLLAEHAGRWVFGPGLSPGGDLPIPESAAAILEFRLQTVGDRPAAVLAAMAVWGRAARTDVLARLTGLDGHEVDRAVATLERRRLVVREDGLPTVAHEALSAAALRAAPGALLEHLHERAARLARDAARGGRAVDWMAAARYAALGGRPERAALDLAHAAAAVERSSGRAAGQDTLTRALGTMPLEVRAHLQIALQRVLEGRWSARRWLAERTSWPRRLRMAAVLAGTVLVGVAAVLAPRLLHSRPDRWSLGGGYLAVTWGDLNARVGGALALRVDSQLAAESLPRRLLPPGVAQGYAEQDVRPGGRDALTTCALPNVDPTAVCAVDLATGARRPLFRYEGDASPHGWLPDGAHFVASGGYLSGGNGGYAYAILLVDSAGRLARTVARDRFSYEIEALSPAGDRILAQRTLGTRRGQVLVDLDGAIRPVAWCQGSSAAAWSPDGATIACIRGTDHTLAIASVASPEEYATVPLGYAEDSPPVWSPDSRYVAVALRGPTRGIYLVDAATLREPVLIWRLPRPDVTISWVPSTAPHHTMRVRVDPESLQVRVGRRFVLYASGTDDSGHVVSPPRGVRWESLDPGVVRLSESGGGVADRPGSARVVAAIGLTQGDTARVLVAGTPARVLLHESFDGGLNRLVWQPFGYPPPRVLPGEGRHGSMGFNNGGDYSRTSGVALRQPLSAVNGLTIEYWARVPIRYPLWESVAVALSTGPADSFAVRQGDAHPVGSYGAVIAQAPNPDNARVQMTAGLNTDVRSSVGTLPRSLRDGGWHRYRLVIYPSGEVRWFADGIEMVPPAEANLGASPTWTLTLEGQSYRTLAMMDDVTVWEGVVLDSVEPARPAGRRAATGRVSK